MRRIEPQRAPYMEIVYVFVERRRGPRVFRGRESSTVLPQVRSLIHVVYSHLCDYISFGMRAIARTHAHTHGLVWPNGPECVQHC